MKPTDFPPPREGGFGTKPREMVFDSQQQNTNSAAAGLSPTRNAECGTRNDEEDFAQQFLRGNAATSLQLASDALSANDLAMALAEARNAVSVLEDLTSARNAEPSHTEAKGFIQL